MPSEKEIEEASLYFSESTNPELCMIRYGKIMLDAYLSMKSERDGLLELVRDYTTAAIIAETHERMLMAERDKYKAIVEADTNVLKRIDSFPEQTTNGITIREMTLVSLAHNALALREK
jgi:hypothetical protein